MAEADVVGEEIAHVGAEDAGQAQRCPEARPQRRQVPSVHCSLLGQPRMPGGTCMLTSSPAMETCSGAAPRAAPLKHATHRMCTRTPLTRSNSRTIRALMCGAVERLLAVGRASPLKASA